MNPPRDPKFHPSNPNMPVIRDYQFANGSTLTEVDPEYESRYREHMMTASAQPSWRSDPTYNMKRRKL